MLDYLADEQCHNGCEHGSELSHDFWLCMVFRFAADCTPLEGVIYHFLMSIQTDLLLGVEPIVFHIVMIVVHDVPSIASSKWMSSQKAVLFNRAKHQSVNSITNQSVG